jgi:hypothetical protein
MSDFELPVEDFWNESEQLAQVQRDYIRPAIDDQDRFDREVRAILDNHLTAAISAAEADVAPMPTSLIHALLAAAFKACRRTADAYMKDNPKFGPGVDDVIAERKSYLMLEEMTKSVLELASLPNR